MPSIPEQLGLLDDQSDARTLKLTTLRQGPIDLGAVVEHHVQGVTRSDQGSKATLVFSVSGEKHGALWLAEFELTADGRHPARCPQLADQGRIVSEVRMSLPHPGGLQAAGNLLAVASEADKGWARIEMFDIARPKQPRLVDTLVLDNSLREGVTQLTGSKAGWLSFIELDNDEYLLFVGGKSFAHKEGWFYRYLPRAQVRWIFEGTFVGAPEASLEDDAWGPQSGAALVRTRDGERPYLVTFGAKGTKGADSYQPRLRCFTVDARPGRPHGLKHEPLAKPGACSLRSCSALSRDLGPNPRWGSTAFVDRDGELLTYFTARNPRPSGTADVHVLELLELRRR